MLTIYKFFLLFFLVTTIGYAEQSVDDLQNQAFTNIDRANAIVAYAQQLLETSPTQESAQRCVDIYLEAALLYGNAARLLKAMGSNYISQVVVDRFFAAERGCLKIVDDFRRQLNKGQIVGSNKETIQSLIKRLQDMDKSL